MYNNFIKYSDWSIAVQVIDYNTGKKLKSSFKIWQKYNENRQFYYYFRKFKCVTLILIYPKDNKRRILISSHS